MLIIITTPKKIQDEIIQKTNKTPNRKIKIKNLLDTTLGSKNYNILYINVLHAI